MPIMEQKQQEPETKMRAPSTLALLAVLLVSALLLGAQEDATATPTETTTPEPEITFPLRQEQLSLLTGNVQRPNALFWFRDYLYAACNGDSTLYEINSRDASTRPYIYGVQNAHTLYVERDDAGTLTIWTPDYERDALVRVTRNGVREVRGKLGGPWGIAPLGEQDFLVTSLKQDRALLIYRGGAAREVLTGLRSPTGIVLDEERVYVANTGSARRAIEWAPRDEVLSDSGIPATTSPLVSGLQNTTGLVLAEDGWLYFAYSLGTRGVVGRVQPEQCSEQGGCSNEEVELVLYSDLEAPLAGLTISPDMRLFVHSLFSPDIFWAQLPEEGEVQVP